jgi:hypothetical protein
MRGRILMPALLVAGSLLFSLLALEAGLRLAGVPLREARVLCFDPVLGNVYCPGIEAQLDNQYESTLPVRINREGMADRDYARAKPPGTIRIALLGDSVAASLYLEPEQKFERLWETALSARFARPVEVLNFAVDGFGTWEQLQLFHLRASNFQPDYVVLAFFWGNDVWNNERSLGKGGPNPLKDEYPETSWYQKLRVAHRSANRWLWNHTLAYQFLRSLTEKAETIATYKGAVQRAREQQQEKAAETGAAVEPVYDPAFAWDSSAWNLTRQLIVKLDAEVRASGARLAVVGIPTLEQLTLPRPLPHARLRAYLGERDIASLDAFQRLATFTKQRLDELYIADRVHLTREGHALFAAETLPGLEAWMRASGPR